MGGIRNQESTSANVRVEAGQQVAGGRSNHTAATEQPQSSHSTWMHNEPINQHHKSARPGPGLGQAEACWGSWLQYR